jgi:hypothetical protein
VNNVQVFRPVSGYIFAAIVYLMAACLSVALWLVDNLQNAISGTVWAVAISLGAHLIFIRPKVTIFDEGVTVTNPLVSYTLGWQLVDDIDVRYALTLVTPAKRISAWAATAPGRYHGRTVHETELKGYRLSNESQIRPGESPRTSSGEAAQLCRIRLDAFAAGNIQGAAAQIKFNTLGTAVLLLAVVAALLIQNLH